MSATEKEELMADANAHGDLSHGAPSAPPASVVERVARIIDPEAFAINDAGRWTYPQYIRNSALLTARRAILALRDPSREMWAASGDAVVALQARNVAHHDAISEAVWQAMIAEALK